MEINERIRMIIESHQLTAGAFAERIGVQRSNVSHVLSGRNKPSFEFLEKIMLAFPRVSAQWLLTGKQLPNGVELEQVVPKSSNINEDTNVNLKGVKNVTDVNSKRVVKMVVFYDDFTFDTYSANTR